MRAVDAGDIDRCLVICVRLSRESCSVCWFEWSLVGEVGLDMEDVLVGLSNDALGHG